MGARPFLSVPLSRRAAPFRPRGPATTDNRFKKGVLSQRRSPPQPAGDLAALPGSHRPPQGKRHFQFPPFDVSVTEGERGAFPSRYASCGRREKGRGPPTCPPRLPCARSPQMSSARRNCSAIWMTVTRPRPAVSFVPLPNAPVAGGRRGGVPSRYASCGGREKGRGPPALPLRPPRADSPQVSSARRNSSATWVAITRPKAG